MEAQVRVGELVLPVEPVENVAEAGDVVFVDDGVGRRPAVPVPERPGVQDDVPSVDSAAGGCEAISLLGICQSSGRKQLRVLRIPSLRIFRPSGACDPATCNGTIAGLVADRRPFGPHVFGRRPTRRCTRCWLACREVQTCGTDMPGECNAYLWTTSRRQSLWDDGFRRP